MVSKSPTNRCRGIFRNKTMTTTNTLPDKKEIIQRLFTAGHITFDEMWVLLQDNEGTKFIPLPYQIPYYPWPYYYQQPPVITEPYYTTSTQIKHE